MKLHHIAHSFFSKHLQRNTENNPHPHYFPFRVDFIKKKKKLNILALAQHHIYSQRSRCVSRGDLEETSNICALYKSSSYSYCRGSDGCELLNKLETNMAARASV